jgi:hypothetical protein
LSSKYKVETVGSDINLSGDSDFLIHEFITGRGRGQKTISRYLVAQELTIHPLPF